MNKYYTTNGVFQSEQYDVSWGDLHRLDGPAVEYENGDKQWWINGQLHRLDGPAIEYINNRKEWWIDDKLHRLDGPAVEYNNGDKHWWINHKRHRLDGAAIERKNGDKIWWINDKRHREDGPAIEWADGSKEWWFEGKRHRTDGSAVEDADGSKEWWIDGYKYREEDFHKEIVRRKNLTSTDENSKNNKPMLNKYYTTNGVFQSEQYDVSWGDLHRLDGPAVYYANGDKYWYCNGRLHRLDGPAIEYADGGKEWFVNGKTHRLDGPAVECPNYPYKQYFIRGVEYCVSDFREKVQEIKNNKYNDLTTNNSEKIKKIITNRILKKIFESIDEPYFTYNLLQEIIKHNHIIGSKLEIDDIELLKIKTVINEIIEVLVEDNNIQVKNGTIK